MSKIRASTQTDASGTPGSTTFLRGDDSWAVPSGGSVPALSTHGDGTGDKSTGSTTYVAMAGISAVSMPAVAGDILEISFAASIYCGTAGFRADMTIGIAGTAKTDYGVARLTFTAINYLLPITSARLYTVASGDISGGDVSVSLMWKTPDVTNINVGNDTPTGIRPVLVVRNLGH